MENTSKIKGFSLLEAISYVALFSLLTAAVAYAFVAVRKSIQLSHLLGRRSEQISNFLVLKDLLEASITNKSTGLEFLSIDQQGRIALAAIDPFSPAFPSEEEIPDGFALRGCGNKEKSGFEIMEKREGKVYLIFSSCSEASDFTPYYILNLSVVPSFVIFENQDSSLCLFEPSGKYCFEQGTEIKLEMLDKYGNPSNNSTEAAFISLKLMPWEATIASFVE